MHLQGALTMVPSFFTKAVQCLATPEHPRIPTAAMAILRVGTYIIYMYMHVSFVAQGPKMERLAGYRRRRAAPVIPQTHQELREVLCLN
jgi:hypothetical protein